MKCAVTGGAGFIGSHVAQALRADGHDVLVIDIKGTNIHIVDICNTSKLTELFMEYRPEFVFHLAATSDAKKAISDPARAVNLSIGGTASVLQASRDSGAKRVVLASTCSVCGAMQPGTVDETHPFLPSGAGHIYVTLKISSELLAHDFYKLYGLPFTILRYGTVYGPRMWNGLVVKIFLERALKGEPLIIHDDGSEARHFIYVEDLAKAHVLAMQDTAENQIYNLEGNRAVTIKELAETVIKLVGNGTIQYQAATVPELKYTKREICGEKIRDHLGWKPEIDIEEGIKRIIEADYESNS